MSNVIPKEQQSAFQRWELGTLSDDRGTGAATRGPSVEEARERAREDGYKAGLAEGRRSGEEAARAEAHAAVTALADLMSRFREEMMSAQAAAADQLVRLALDIARAVIRAEVNSRPDLVLKLTEELLQQLPASATGIIVHVHPDDAANIRAHLAAVGLPDGWRLASDATVGRGGCRIVTDQSVADATFPARWDRVCKALGADTPWKE